MFCSLNFVEGDKRMGKKTGLGTLAYCSGGEEERLLREMGPNGVFQKHPEN